MNASNQHWVTRCLAHAAFWLSVCSLFSNAVSAQCTNPTQVPNGTYTSGDHSISDNNALAASNYSLSQAASATFAAGNCIHLAPGFRANAVGATVPTTFQTWVESTPTAVSFLPSNQSSLSQTFTWTVSNASGVSNLAHVLVQFNPGFAGAVNGCYIYYNRVANLLYLANDAANSWVGGFAPGSGGGAGNSQCSISGVGATVSTAGTQLSVQVPVTFQASTFAGTKNQLLYAQDIAGLNSGWQTMGTWTIPSPPAPDFIFTAPMNPLSAQTGVPLSLTYNLAISPQNGFNSQVNFNWLPFSMPGCYPNPTQVMPASAPNWASTITIGCQAKPNPVEMWTWVTATGGGKSHQIELKALVGPNQNFYLMTATTPSGGGSIIPDSGWRAPGGTVILTATPNSGFVFSGFSGVDSSNGPTGYVTMNSNRNVTATFAPLVSSASAPLLTPGPGAYPSPQNVALTTSTGGASIFYTVNGGEPSSSNGMLYTNPFQVATTTTIRAIAVKSGLASSGVTTGTYTIGSAVGPPSFSPPSGSYSLSQWVTITSGTSGASIRYTTDGSTPTPTNGLLFTGMTAVPVTPTSVPTTTTLKAIAYTSTSMSPVVSSVYAITPGIVAAPTFSPGAGTLTSTQSVTIASSSTASGASIRYTIDGTDPTPTAGILYSGPVTFAGPGTKTIRAIAYQAGLTDSPVTSATYNIQAPTSTKREYIWMGGRIIAIDAVQ